MTGGWSINLQGNAFLPACILMCSLENLPSHVYMQGVASNDNLGFRGIYFLVLLEMFSKNVGENSKINSINQ